MFCVVLVVEPITIIGGTGDGQLCHFPFTVSNYYILTVKYIILIISFLE